MTTKDNIPEPDPIPNDARPTWDLVVEDMKARNQAGTEKYGTPLQPHNGRRQLVDAYQEALDLTVYLKNEILERDGDGMEVALEAERKEASRLRDRVFELEQKLLAGAFADGVGLREASGATVANDVLTLIDRETGIGLWASFGRMKSIGFEHRSDPNGLVQKQASELEKYKQGISDLAEINRRYGDVRAKLEGLLEEAATQVDHVAGCLRGLLAAQDLNVKATGVVDRSEIALCEIVKEIRGALQ